jgi:beta-glucosidase
MKKLSEVNLSSLPKSFMWGAATASFQIEGGYASGDRGRCIWDDLCDVPGAISDGTKDCVGVEHLTHLDEDLDLIKWMNLDTYRFSFSWPRVQPTGSGEFNEKGMQFYDRLVDGLLARGIVPNATLYHWDLPSELQAIGGWANPVVVDKFAAYAEKMAERFADRITYWATFNEPWCTTYLGNTIGVHAPGIKDLPTTVKVAHQLVRAHALASSAIKRKAPKAKVGVVLNLGNQELIGESTPQAELDIKIVDGLVNRWWLQGMLQGKYPVDILDTFEELTGIRPDEKEIADTSNGRDWVGLNYYQAGVYKAADTGIDVHPGTKAIDGAPFGDETTDIGWSWTPDGFNKTLHYINNMFPQIPILITENGACYNNEPGADGNIHDDKREEYLALYISAAVRARSEGVNLIGYYVWSLLDNFEWAYGFSMRFGIVFVDLDTMKRTPKQSAHSYRAMIQK